MGEKDKVRVPDLARSKKRGRSIVSITAYDYTFARLADEAGIDVILVGDSLGMVVQGKSNTLSVTLDEMIYHSQMVVRGASRALVVADLPFMSYQLGKREALAAAGRMVKEGGVEAVKLEGGSTISESVSCIVEAGIPVMGHLGLTPQSYHQMGGHRVQGRSAEDFDRILRDAETLERAGAFSIVLEGIPKELASEVTQLLKIPTIGIGAGDACSGQVLVLHDVLGLSEFADGGKPKFVKHFGDIRNDAIDAIERFVSSVRSGDFPGDEHSYELRAPNLAAAKKRSGSGAS